MVMNMKYLADYDKTNPQSIEDYAQKLIGKTFADVVIDDMHKTDEVHENSSYAEEHADIPGFLGTILQAEAEELV